MDEILHNLRNLGMIPILGGAGYRPSKVETISRGTQKLDRDDLGWVHTSGVRRKTSVLALFHVGLSFWRALPTLDSRQTKRNTEATLGPS